MARHIENTSQKYKLKQTIHFFFASDIISCTIFNFGIDRERDMQKLVMKYIADYFIA